MLWYKECMTRPWRIVYPGAKYHVTVRGNARQAVFHEQRDYEKFIEQLKDALDKDEVKLYAFVIMPNHYHLFVEPKHGNIQRFMQRLNTSYSMYHRYKHKKPGHCFQGRYGAKLVKGDDYVIRLTRYIHLNPVKVAACKGMKIEEKINLLNSFKWSSYRRYAGMPDGLALKIDDGYLSMMNRLTDNGNRAAYRRYVEGCISRSDAEMLQALALSRYAVGSPKFLEQIEDELKEVKVNKGVYGDIRWPEGRKYTIKQITAAVALEFGEKAEDLKAKHSYGWGRKIAIELSSRHSGLSQRQIGEYFGYGGNGSVLKQRNRLRDMLKADDALQKRITRIEKGLANA
jgi:REP element-mobilizing transposase RayT